MGKSNSNSQVNIAITEPSANTYKIELDNEPFNLAGLGTGTPPQSGAPIQWVIDQQSVQNGWDFSANGVQIKSAGTNFSYDSQSPGRVRWKRKNADSGYYAYSISVTKTVNGNAAVTIIIDPTIINQP